MSQPSTNSLYIFTQVSHPCAHFHACLHRSRSPVLISMHSYTVFRNPPRFVTCFYMLSEDSERRFSKTQALLQPFNSAAPSATPLRSKGLKDRQTKREPYCRPAPLLGKTHQTKIDNTPHLTPHFYRQMPALRGRLLGGAVNKDKVDRTAEPPLRFEGSI